MGIAAARAGLDYDAVEKGAVVAGSDGNRVFIESGRFHGARPW